MNILKERRTSLGLSLDDVSKDLNIRVYYLNALENYTIAKLIGKVYINGYLKLYTNYLGIDNYDELLENCLMQDKPLKSRKKNTAEISKTSKNFFLL